MSDAEDEVRRLLADARHTAPVPTDVAARLDQRLAELSLPPVDDELAAVRRRRAAALLVAAVAIVAVGIGAGNLVGPEPMDMATGGSDESGAAPEAASPEADAPGGSAGDGAGSFKATSPGAADAQSAGRLSLADLEIVKVPATLHSDHLGRDVRVVVEDVRLSGGATVPDPDAVLASYDCEPAPFGEGTLVAATYDTRPAIMALRPPEGRNQIVDILACGTGEQLASLTVPTQ